MGKHKNKKSKAEVSREILTPTSHTEVKSNKVHKFSALNDKQKTAIKTILANKVSILYGSPGTGKTKVAVGIGLQEFFAKKYDKIILTRPYVEAGEKMGFLPGPQPLTAKILTPHGWTTMGEILEGDLVVGKDGKPTRVTKVLPKGQKMTYRITTTDGTSTECCIDHLWNTRTFEDKKRGRSGCTKTTEQILNTLYKKDGKPNHYLPRNEPIEFKKNKLPIPAYTMGVLLGDGCISGDVSFSNIDQEIIDRVSDECKEIGCYVSKNKNSISYNICGNCTKNKPARKIKITNITNGECREFEDADSANIFVNINKSTLKNRCSEKRQIDNMKYEFIKLKERWSNPIKNKLENLDLLGRKALTKFIPDIYKYSSVDDRLNLLKGLMDTDGNINPKGCASFTTISEQLALDVAEVVRSLGGRAVIKNRGVRKGGLIRGRRVNSKHSTYEFTISLPKGLNPFHIKRKASRVVANYMHLVAIKSIEPVSIKDVQCITVDNTEHLYITDQFIVTHNSMGDKIAPFMMPIYDALADSLSKADIKDLIDQEKIMTLPVGFMRGVTLKNAFVICDECQNTSVKQMHMILTRLGQNSKFVITGDLNQSDLYSITNGLADAIDRLGGIPHIGMVEFGKEDCVRDPLVAEIDGRYTDNLRRL